MTVQDSRRQGCGATRRLALCFGLCVVLMPAAASAAVIFVAPTGNNANDGLSWATAKQTVTAGLATAAGGDQVWVAAGTYVERITLKADVGLYGGLAGDEDPATFDLTARELTAHATVLDGARGGTVVTGPTGATTACRIDGFTITNGEAPHGGGLYLEDSSPTVANNIIRGNSGGAAYLVSSDALIINNAILGNGGGSFYASESAVLLINNTIAGNSGGGVHFLHTSSTIANSIIAFNSSGIATDLQSSLTLAHNCVYGNGASDYSGVPDPTGSNGNISIDPLLASVDYGNSHIQPDSPCVDAGDNTLAGAPIDIDGHSRVIGDTVDIGADESDGTLWPGGPYAVVHVRPDGDDAQDGSSWATAKHSIQAAADSAAIQGGDVWVQEGVYRERLMLRAYAYLYGGFAGCETAREERALTTARTIIDGQDGGTVVTARSGHHVSALDGFLITHGRAASGGGLYIYGAATTIANNTITSNSASYGGGLYVSASDSIVANNTIVGNSASSQGGGAMIYGHVFATNNTIVNNGAPEGGGIATHYSSATIANTIIAHNSSGLYVVGPGPDLRFTCVYGNGVVDYDGIADPTGFNGNIASDPLLADPAYGNCHLQPGSPCIDAGSNADVFGSVDADQQPRVQPSGGTVDIGADEADGTTWAAGPYSIIRVRQGGNDAADGSSWDLAKGTVQAAIDVAGTLGGEVWVQAGTYSESINLRAHAYVYGGFAGTETQRDQRAWTENPTVLHPLFGGSVVTARASNLGGAVDGFTITHGDATTGGGICVISCSPTIANNTIVSNSASDDGAGIYLSSSTAMITNNIIENNSTSRSSNSDGGGLCAVSSRPVITGNKIIANNAANGGGIHLASSTAIIANNLICANGATFGGGVYASEATITLSGNTLASNSAGYGAGLYLNKFEAVIANTIIAHNASGIYRAAGDYPSLRSCCVYGNTAYDYFGMPDPTSIDGNIAADPQFADVTYGNYHLQPGSPCTNGGSNADVYGDVDVDGEPRIDPAAGVVDIGADEADGTLWEPGPHRIVRVRTDGDDTADGSTWLLAKRTVQAAIDAAAAVGGDVWLQGGTYQGCVTLHPYAHVFGGFTGDEILTEERDWRSSVTVLDGQQLGPVVFAQAGHRVSTIDGLTIMGGNASSPSGGTASSGGGLQLYRAGPLVRNCVIRGNRATGDGGGIHVTSASPLINSSLIASNWAFSGGGVGLSLSSATIANSIVSTNGAVRGGGIFVQSSTATVSGCTIVGNSSVEHGGGLYLTSITSTVANTIIAFNSTGTYCYYGSPAMRHNCSYGNNLYNYGGITDPTGTNGNIACDPRLGDWHYGNYHIQPDSPCVDSGNSADVHGEEDIDGQPRAVPTANAVDIGADESNGTVWAPGPYAVVRVRPDGDDDNDGSSWPEAMRTVRAAIHVASAVGGDVWVQAGTYHECITLLPNAMLFGGFAGHEIARKERNWGANRTVLDGQGQGSVVTVNLGNRVNALDGFTLTHGYASIGGGLLCSAGAVIANNTITENSAYNYGGGISLACPGAVLMNNVIAGNVAATYGGGLYLGAGPVIVNNTIISNSAVFGGAIYAYGNVLFSVGRTLANNIVASNSSGILVRGAGGAVLHGNNVYGNGEYDYSGITDPGGADGNISADPLFVDTASGDYRLRAGSPCVDAGDNAAVPADVFDLDGDGDTAEPLPFDLGGRTRFVDDPFAADCPWTPGTCGTAPVVDMGAYERQRNGDCDLDWIIDIGDAAAFEACMNGPAGAIELGCACGDFDGDGDIDVADVAALQRAFEE